MNYYDQSFTSKLSLDNDIIGGVGFFCCLLVVVEELDESECSISSRG